MKKHAVCFLLLASLLVSSCASILNGRYQTVYFTTPSHDSKVYVDGEYIDKGSYVEARVKRDVKAKQIKVERPGYKEEYTIFVQKKKSLLYIMSVVPFGMLMYPIVYDVGPKAYNYPKEKELTVEHKNPTHNENEKYVYLNDVKINVKKEDYAISFSSDKRFKKGKKNRNVTTNENDVAIENTIYADYINEYLKDNGYTDTTNTIFKNQSNTLYLMAEINKITFNALYTRTGYYYNVYYVTDIDINWKIQDAYKQTKYETTISSRSGEFVRGDKGLNLSIGDAIKASLVNLMEKQEVRRFYGLEQDKVFPTILSVPAAAHAVNDLEGARAATVTIKLKDGHGSGCVVSNDGYIVTNYHVIAGESDKGIQVITGDGNKYKAKVIRYNDFADLALLKVDGDFEYAYAVPDAKNFRYGDDMYAIGTPKSIELGQTLSKGIVSGLRKQDSFDFIQTDVSVNPGNSGGALVNKTGSLVGIVNSKLVGVGIEGIAFCIPAKDINRLLGLRIR